MPQAVSDALREYIKGLHNIYGSVIEKIILYGSYARGDFNKDSDIDIMILTDLKDEEYYQYFEKISDFTYDLEYDNNFDIEISPVIKNIDRFNYWLEALPFYINVQNEGVVLNER